MTILLKIICRFKLISVKILMIFFRELELITFKIV